VAATGLSPLELFHQQLALERKGVDSAGLLFRIPGDNPDEMGRVLTARLADGEYVAYLRDDLPESVIDALRTLTPQQLHYEHSRVLRILGAEGPSGAVAPISLHGAHGTKSISWPFSETRSSL